MLPSLRQPGHGSRRYKQIAGNFKPEIEVFANFPSNYMG